MHGKTIKKLLDLITVESLEYMFWELSNSGITYKGADKSLARPGRKQATATEEEFDVHTSNLKS